MSAKGVVTGNGPADRLVERMRTLNAPVAATSKQEIAGCWVELKRAVRAALPAILTAERNRTIASARGRLDRLPGFISGQSLDRRAVLQILDDMEAEA